jgi:LDH2 family malate/lactate/ureidoglycolate dehydrogenase
MAFLVEVLGGILTGGGFCGQTDDPLFNNPSCLIALDVERFRPLAAFQDEIERLIVFLKATPHREGEEVLYPGEVEERCERERRANGIPLPLITVRNLQGELDRFKIGMKLEDLALG